MFHQIWNLIYYRHLKIINCVGFEQLIFAINVDVLSSFNVFSTLVYVCLDVTYRCSESIIFFLCIYIYIYIYI